ncbi:hypothetical protein [Lactobacillus crispatus]|uniref:hypothetical protein n=1 Tax=Lactobacillus crispatus TaxID=47770 RepID=UPI001F090F99
MRKKFSLVLLLTTIFTISLTACTNQNKVDHTKSQTKITSTPTLFFHGVVRHIILKTPWWQQLRTLESRTQ